MVCSKKMSNCFLLPSKKTLYPNRRGTIRTCCFVIWSKKCIPPYCSQVWAWISWIDFKESRLGRIPQVTENNSPFKAVQHPSALHWEIKCLLKLCQKETKKSVICGTYTLTLTHKFLSLKLVGEAGNKLLMHTGISLWDVRLPIGIHHAWISENRCDVLHHIKHSRILLQK